MKPASEGGENLLQSVTLQAAASGPLRIHSIGDDARRQKTLKHSILAVTLCVLITVTLMVICYKRNRVHVGPTDRGRRLAAGWSGQENDYEEEESWILDSCLDLESELALPSQHLNPLQNEEEAIRALTLDLLAEAENFELGAQSLHDSSSSFFMAEAIPATQSAYVSLPAFSSSSPTNIGSSSAESSVSQEVASEALAGSQEQNMTRAPCAYPATASSHSSQQTLSSYQHVDNSSSQFEASGMSGRHFLQGAAAFTSDSRGGDLGHSVDSALEVRATESSPFLQFTGFADLSRLTAGRKRPSTLAEGELEDALVKKMRGTESESGESETRHYSNVEGDGGFAQSPSISLNTVFQPLSAAIQNWPTEPHASQSTWPSDDASQGPQFPSNLIRQFLRFPPNPRLLEGGEAIFGKALQPFGEEEEFRGIGYVSIILRSGEEIRVPHPPPPLEPGCHGFYRLPKVPRLSMVAEFDSGVALGPVRFRGIPYLLHIMRIIFSQTELTGEHVSGLCGVCEELVNYLLTHHRTSLKKVYPHRAADRLALRFLCFEGLVCAIQTLGPAMNAQEWFPTLVEAIPTDYSYFGGTRLPRALHFKTLSKELSEALRLLKLGVRPSPEDILNLRRRLFDKSTAPFVFRSPNWDFGREEFQDSSDSS